jgi:hypothetical protein
VCSNKCVAWEHGVVQGGGGKLTHYIIIIIIIIIGYAFPKLCMVDISWLIISFTISLTTHQVNYPSKNGYLPLRLDYQQHGD